MVRAIPISWPGLIGKCRSIFLGYCYLSLTGQFGIMESTLNLLKILDPVFERPPACWIDVRNIIAKQIAAIDIMEDKKKSLPDYQ